MAMTPKEIRQYQIARQIPVAYVRTPGVSGADKTYFNNTGTTIISNEIQDAIVELDSRSSAIGQKQLDVVVIGHAGTDVLGVTCDYDETSFVGGILSLATQRIIIKSTFDGTGLTLRISGATIIDTIGTLIDTIENTFIGTIPLILNGNMTITNLVNDFNVYNSHYDITNVTGNSNFINSDIEFTSVTGDLILYNCYSDSTTSITAMTGNLTCNNTQLGRITLTGNVIANDSYIDRITVTGDAILNNSASDRITGGTVNALTMKSSSINTLTGDCVSLNFTGSSILNASLSNITTNVTLNNSFIHSLGNIGGNISLLDSKVTFNINSVAGTINIVNSDLAIVNALTNVNVISSNNSKLTVKTGSVIIVNGDIDIHPTGAALIGDPSILTFGDGTAANDIHDSHIRIIDQVNSLFTNYLTMNDNPNGVGTTYKNNVFEVLFGEKATFNLTGGATNILKRTGKTAGITDTANNYTKFETNY